MLMKFFKKLFRVKKQPPTIDYADLYLRGMDILGKSTISDDFAGLEKQLRRELWLYQRWGCGPKDSPLVQELHALRRIEGLAHVYMFHGDGRIREASLRALDGPLNAPAQVYGVFWRANDWAAPVREAAMAAMARCLPVTPASVMAPALQALLPHVPSWGRWSEVAAEEVYHNLARPDVAATLLDDMLDSRKSGLGLVFRQLCRSNWIDTHLEDIACSSALPHLRAMALDALVSGQVRWATGVQKKRWVSEYKSRYRVDQVFETRALTVKPNLAAILRLAVTDKASIVRKRVADALIALRHDAALQNDLAEIGEQLLDDKNIGVRARMDFLARKLAQETSDVVPETP